MKKLTVITTALAVSLWFAGSVSALPIFSDDFARKNSKSLGDPWVETEAKAQFVKLKKESAQVKRDGSGFALDLDTTGLEAIEVDFDWKAKKTETDDFFVVSYSTGGGPIIELDKIALGTKGVNSSSVDLGALSDMGDVTVYFSLDLGQKKGKINVDNIFFSGQEMAALPLATLLDVDDDLPGTQPGAPVPEPASMLLLGTGLAGIIGARRFRKKS